MRFYCYKFIDTWLLVILKGEPISKASQHPKLSLKEYYFNSVDSGEFLQASEKSQRKISQEISVVEGQVLINTGVKAQDQTRVSQNGKVRIIFSFIVLLHFLDCIVNILTSGFCYFLGERSQKCDRCFCLERVILQMQIIFINVHTP